MKTIKFHTNTAWLLNMWILEGTRVFGDVRKWVEEKHENHWKRINSSVVEVTFKILPTKKERRIKK